MFSQKEKQNTDYSKNGLCYKEAQLFMHRQRSREEKEKKISNLRQIYTSQTLNWAQPLNSFLQVLEGNHNHYSLLLTLFEISEDPLWRNRIPHICTLIKRLHNECVDKKGNYLPQMTQIPNYNERLSRIFYLNDTRVQEHFKLLMLVYLSFNARLGILNEADVAVGLVQAGRHRSDNKFQEYMWIVSQLRVDGRTIIKILKYGSQMLGAKLNNEQFGLILTQSLIPMVTTISNYLCYEQNPFVLDQLVQNQSFQGLIMNSLLQKTNPHLSREALLLCNNLLAKSQALANKLLSSAALMSAASQVQCEQQQYFELLTQMRSEQRFLS